MMMMILYQATPLEQAHSLFLVQQCFGIHLPLANGVDISISGKSAVQFLTQSNVDRQLLRSIWSVADPNNFGSLTSIHQFRLILRLVAMAQAGVPLLNVDLATAVQQHASAQLNLPFFSNVVVPPMNQLLGMYGNQPQNNNSNFNSVNNNNNFNSVNNSGNSFPASTPQQQQRPQIITATAPAPASISDAFGGLVEVQDAPLTPLPSMPAYNASATTPTVSLSDAFADMGESTNAPLPALSPMKQNSGITESNNAGLSPMRTMEPQQASQAFRTTPSSSRFGQPTTPTGFVPRQPTTPSSSTGGGFGFWSLGGGSAADHANRINNKVASTPTRPLPSTVPSIVPESVSDDDDDFGDFGSAQPTAMPSIPAQPNISSTSQPNSGLTMTSGQQQQQTLFADNQDNIDDDDDFGDFGSALPTTLPSIPAQPTFGMQTVSNNTVPVSDAFGDMIPSVDAPLPSLDAFGNSATQNEEESSEEESDSEDDGFGNFEGVESATNRSTLVEPSNDMFGQQPSIPPAVTESGPSLSITDAFGDMPIQDAPLPSLGGIVAATPAVSNVPSAIEAEDDDDGFGDFEDAKPTTVLPEPTVDVESASGSSEEDDFGDFGGPSVTEAGPSLSITDAFGDMPVQPDAPLPSLGQWTAPSESNTDGIPSNNDDDDDDFGDFEAPAESMTSPSALEQPTSITRSVSIDDAFGDFAAPEDAPLPPLELLSQPTGTQGETLPSAENVNEGDDEDDEFGDFDAAPEEDMNDNGDNDEDDDDEFGDFGEAPAENEAVEEAADMGFGAGGFVSSTPEDIPQPSVSDDPFADMPSNDAPLPPLEMFSSAIQNVESKDDSEDDFGGFETSAAVEASSEAPAKETSGNILDLYGTIPSVPVARDPPTISAAFGALEVASLSVPSLDQENDLFGDFASSTNNEPADTSGNATGELLDIFGSETATQPIATSFDEQDGFGDFGGAEAVPTTSVEEQEEEDFGDFGGAEITTPAEQTSQEDDFGDFGSAPAQQIVQEDDFGVFGSSSAPTTQESVQVDDFGDFGSAAAQQTPVPEDDFGGFGGASADNTDQGDLFGDFGGAPSVDNSVQVDNFGNFESPSADQEDAFGGFGGAPVQQPVDDFGGFGSAPAQQVVPEDNFGDFGSAPAQVEDESSDPVEDTPQPVDKDDDFGDFGSANIAASTEETQPQEQDDFGAFGSATSTDDNASSQNEEDDDFGDFGSAQAQPPVDNFGAFDSATSQPVEKSGDEDFFGTFGSAEPAAPVDQNDAPQFDAFASTEQNTNASENDDFGDFGSANISSPAADEAPSVDADEFGDFTVVEAPPTTSDQQGNDDFGGFASFQESSPPPESSADDNGGGDDNDDDDDWGDFEAVSAPSEQVQIRDRIHSLALQLPGDILRKSNGDRVDLGQAFEIQIGMDTLTQASKLRAQRCIRILEALCNSTKLASVWTQIFGVVNEELERAIDLLGKATPAICKELKEPLSVMIRGLAEYMRVTRSIVASIGDLLLLDESALLSRDTWASTWCSLSLLEAALECEQQWKAFQDLVKTTSLTSSVRAVTLEEIRSVHYNDEEASSLLCQLTLQPLQTMHKDSTQAKVSFRGKSFMACSANFIANRCPMVGDEL